MADGLLNKASIILTPTGYKAGTLYNVAPIDEPYEDFDFARTSTATRINSSGLVSNVATGVPRISYDSNGDNGHILLEPTSTNLITYSEDFEDSSWDLDVNAAHITRTPNAAISPSGENNATKLIGNDTSRDPGGSYIAAITSASAPYTASVFAKKAEYDYLLMSVGTYAGGYWGSFNLSNGTVDTQPTQANTSASIESYGNGWYRCSLTTTTASGGEFCLITPSVDGTLLTDYTSTTNGIYVWGAQLEELSYATSYIPTLTGSTETRATETATGAGSAELINSTEGVLYAEIAALVDDLSFRTISLSDGTTSNRCVLRYGGTTNRVNVLISSGGSIIFDNNFTLTEITDFSKIAVKWKVNDFALWVDGVERATDSSGAAPIGLSQLQLSNYNSSSNDFYGKCKALAVFNEALSDDELHNLTG